MLEVKELDFKSQSLDSHLTKSRIFGDKLMRVKKSLSLFSIKHLRAAIQKLSEIDKISKGITKMYNMTELLIFLTDGVLPIGWWW